jgi:hypothetical protein
MFHIEQVANEDYFCCPKGYIGVLPVRGAAGICELEGVDVPKSQIATLASQIGTAGPSPSGRLPTAATTDTGSETAAGGGRQPTSSVSGDGTDTNSNSSISTGAIAGIAVGAVAVLILAFALIMWLHRRSLRKRPSQAAAPVYQTISPSEPHADPTQGYGNTVEESQAKQPVFAQINTPAWEHGHFQPAHGAHEVQATPRLEMEAPTHADGRGCHGDQRLL